MSRRGLGDGTDQTVGLCQAAERAPLEVCNLEFKGSPVNMIVCLCPNTVSCLGVEVEFTHAREWPASVAMAGLSPWIQAMRRGFWVQRVTFCLLPFLYLVSLYQAVHSYLGKCLFAPNFVQTPRLPFLIFWKVDGTVRSLRVWLVSKRAEPTQQCPPHPNLENAFVAVMCTIYF